MYDVEKTICKCHVNRMMFGFPSVLFCLHLLCNVLCTTCYWYEKCYINEVRLIDMRLTSVGGVMDMTVLIDRCIQGETLYICDQLGVDEKVYLRTD